MTTSPLKVEDSRAQFELAYSNLTGTPVSVLKNLRDSDEYRETEGDRLNISWSMWQSSRAAIVVELPPAMGGAQTKWDGTDWNVMREHAVKAIRAAGITVKGDSDGK